MTYIVYTRKFPPCPYCDSAKKYLEYKGIKYEEKFIEDDDNMELFKANGWKTVPQILEYMYLSDGVYGTTYIGGYKDLVEHLKGFIIVEGNKNVGE